jgi:hypothetical protein
MGAADAQAVWAGRPIRTRMEPGDLNFVVWWYATLAVLGIACWRSSRSGEEFDWAGVARVFMIGIAAALVLYMAPNGMSSVHSPQDLELRFFGALAITWLMAMRTLRSEPAPTAYSSLALAGFAGVNAPLLAYAASIYMVTGGTSGGF